MSETARLTDQIRRAFDGEAWHGDAVLRLLRDVNAKTAAKRPLKSAHSIWELVLHIAAWDDAVLRRTRGEIVRVPSARNFPRIKDTSEAAWREAVAQMKRTHNELVKAVAAFPDSRLHELVSGKSQKHHNFYYMFSGVAQHELYHAGQIALLKKAQGLAGSR
jgi:uncharacterized damage-inducible protein DinB